MLQTVDSWLIDKFEWFSHWTQRCFGLTSGTWERWCLLLSMVGLGCKEMPNHWGTVRFALEVFLLFIFLGEFVWSIYRQEARAANPTFMNSRKLGNQCARPIFLAFAILLAYHDWSNPSHSMWYQISRLADYFAACDDLPPGVSKLKRLLDSVRRGLAPATAAPTPA